MESLSVHVDGDFSLGWRLTRKNLKLTLEVIVQVARSLGTKSLEQIGLLVGGVSRCRLHSLKLTSSHVIITFSISNFNFAGQWCIRDPERIEYRSKSKIFSFGGVRERWSIKLQFFLVWQENGRGLTYQLGKSLMEREESSLIKCQQWIFCNLGMVNIRADIEGTGWLLGCNKGSKGKGNSTFHRHPIQQCARKYNPVPRSPREGAILNVSEFINSNFGRSIKISCYA